MRSTFSFTQSRYYLAEGQNGKPVEVERLGSSDGSVSVTVAAYPSLSSATVLPRVSGVGEDVAIARQTLTWADGETGPKAVEVNLNPQRRIQW